MNSVEINNILKDIVNFKGVCALDCLPKPFKVGSMIVNTHTSNLKGQHWIAFKVTNTDIIFFDPLNFSIPLLLYKYFLSFNKNCISVNFSSQNILSNTCGIHCIYFILLDKPCINDF